MENPFQIQEGSETQTPLFLIHDGGGTIFQYCLLHDLDRDIWGIQNPYFSDVKQGVGTLREMSEIYTMVIKSIRPYGDIIVGGWSLGGCIALEVAHLLRDQDDLHVKGILMLDSMYPTFRPDASKAETYLAKFLETVPEDIRSNVQRCMDQAMCLLSGWRGPEWSKREVDKDSTSDTVHKSTEPPPIVLIRAREEIPSDWGTMDATRKDTFLGWDRYMKNPFKKILHVPGHHFSIFEGQNIVDVTEAIQDACAFLEKA